MDKPNSKKLLTYIKRIKDKKEINHYYQAAMDDYMIGHPLSFLKKILGEMEEDEDYLACAGISRAIKEIEKNTK